MFVYDGVRSFVDLSLILGCIRSTMERGSVITVTLAIEVIVTIDSKRITSIINRSKCYH